jgi:hypothetical protein
MIRLFIISILFLLFSVNLSEAQTLRTGDGGKDAKILSQPLYKGVLFQEAVKNYVDNVAINVYPSVFPLSKYYSEVQFQLKKNGSLKTVIMTKSTGIPELDHEIIVACKDFVKKKHVTPAYSSEGPVDYSFTVPFEVEYYDVPKNSAQSLRYQKAAPFRGMTPNAAVHNKEYGTLH